MLSVNLSRLPYFVSVVETGSFSAAARQLGVAKAVVSHQLAKLEEELGTTLLIRTTRKVRPTDEGQRFYYRCSDILRRSGEALEELDQTNTMPSGTLRLTAPQDYGVQVVVPSVRDFMKRYDGVRVELSLDDSRIDIVEANIDISIRVGWLRDSSATMRKIASFQQIAVATPALLQSYTDPRRPADLQRLPFIANTALDVPLQWDFKKEGQTRIVQFQANLSADRTAAVFASVKAELGFAILPDYLVAEELAKGTLKALLPDWSLPEGGIFAVFPPSRFRPAKSRAFFDILRAVHFEQCTTR